MTDGDGLLAAILADPDDDTVRLVYADWLQENGQGERAEFIRVQIRLAVVESGYRWAKDKPCEDYRCAPGYGKPCRVCAAVNCWTREFEKLKSRERQLLRHLDEWYPPCCKTFGYYDWDRGFIARVECTAADWLAHEPAIRAAHPVRSLVLTTRLEVHVLATGFEKARVTGYDAAGRYAQNDAGLIIAHAVDIPPDRQRNLEAAYAARDLPAVVRIVGAILWGGVEVEVTPPQGSAPANTGN